MAKIKSITIKCGHCQEIFHSPIFVGDTASLDSARILGNRTNCPTCKEIIFCNKDNMSVLYADGSGGEMYWNWGDNKG